MFRIVKYHLTLMANEIIFKNLPKRLLINYDGLKWLNNNKFKTFDYNFVEIYTLINKTDWCLWKNMK